MNPCPARPARAVRPVAGRGLRIRFCAHRAPARVLPHGDLAHSCVRPLAQRLSGLGLVESLARLRPSDRACGQIFEVLVDQDLFRDRPERINEPVRAAVAGLWLFARLTISSPSVAAAAVAGTCDPYVRSVARRTAGIPAQTCRAGLWYPFLRAWRLPWILFTVPSGLTGRLHPLIAASSRTIVAGNMTLTVCAHRRSGFGSSGEESGAGLTGSGPVWGGGEQPSSTRIEFCRDHLPRPAQSGPPPIGLLAAYVDHAPALRPAGGAVSSFF